MDTLVRDAIETPALVLPPADLPIRVDGKFFRAGVGEHAPKHYVKGVSTYGPFGPGSHGAQFPENDTVDRDFALMTTAGVNSVRVFTVPPVWLLDIAAQHGLKVLVGLPWSEHVTFLDDPCRAGRASVTPFISGSARLRPAQRRCLAYPSSATRSRPTSSAGT